MLLHSVQRFQSRPDVGMVVCVLPRSHVGDPPPWLFQSDLERLLISVGGPTRQASVEKRAAGPPGGTRDRRRARCGAAARVGCHNRRGDRRRARWPGRGRRAAGRRYAQGSRRGRPDLLRTVERTRLWRAQTPQAFPREILVRAHEAANRDKVVATDDAALCERLGILVVGEPRERTGQ